MSASWVVFGEPLDLEGHLETAVHYVHNGEPTKIQAASIVLNGRMINSASRVEVELSIFHSRFLRPVTPLGSLFLDNAALPGTSATLTLNGVALTPGDVVQARVSNGATVSAGTGCITLCLKSAETLTDAIKDMDAKDLEHLRVLLDKLGDVGL